MLVKQPEKSENFSLIKNWFSKKKESVKLSKNHRLLQVCSTQNCTSTGSGLRTACLSYVSPTTEGCHLLGYQDDRNPQL